MLCSQAPGAKVESLFLAVYNDIGGMDIWRPLAIGTSFGVAYVMTELR